jgi:hypothetical protein
MREEMDYLVIDPHKGTICYSSKDLGFVKKYIQQMQEMHENQGTIAPKYQIYRYLKGQ